jgi:hypothetical protein
LPQETLASWLNSAPFCSGLRTTDQWAPFHDSARVSTTELLLVYSPTALQADLPGQETPSSELPVAPLGFGLEVIDQRDPFHASAKVLSTPLRLKYVPTAMHLSALAQDTAANVLWVVPFGFGLGTMDQRDPFHDSAKLTGTPLPLMDAPTATQSVRL